MKEIIRIHPLPKDNKVWGYEIPLVSTLNGISNKTSYLGLDLVTLLKEYGVPLLGPDQNHKELPILIKELSSHKGNLSVQVHPDEEVAKKLGVRPKSEFWYITHSDEGSILTSIGLDSVGENLNEFNLVLNYKDVSHQDAFYVESGTLHAIMKGVRLIEIQQPSDTTYRMFDWNRDRELQVNESYLSTNFHQKVEEVDLEEQFTCDYFNISKHTRSNTKEIDTWYGNEFRILIGLEGLLVVGEERLYPNEVLVVPYSMKSFEVDGLGSYLVVTITAL